MNSRKLAQLIQQSHRIVALTGAGISTSAGIPDFRGPKGIYVTHQYDPERTFDIEWFDKDPRYFFNFARDFLSTINHIEPTRTHAFLARLEHRGSLTTVITQNIDGLHQKAGSRSVIEVHGSFRQGHCRHCGQACGYERLKRGILANGIPHCETCGGVIKPDIVFYGEAVRGMDEAQGEAHRADLFLVIGTSLTVYPAAMLPQLCAGPIICVGQGPISGRDSTMEQIDRDIDTVFMEVESLLDTSS
ncbi:MAG: SIR2 family NAD-dependent protein deacylase [Candidatus Cryosericum sp.]